MHFALLSSVKPNLTAWKPETYPRESVRERCLTRSFHPFLLKIRVISLKNGENEPDSEMGICYYGRLFCHSAQLDIFRFSFVQPRTEPRYTSILVRGGGIIQHTELEGPSLIYRILRPLSNSFGRISSHMTSGWIIAW